MRIFTVICVLLYAPFALGENIPLREHVSQEQKVAISFPSTWKSISPNRNEILFFAGPLRETAAGCYIRTSTVENLRLVRPDTYFAQVDEKSFVKLTSMSTPDVQVHRYDFSSLGGRKARRIIYSGTDSGRQIGNLIHQTLDGNRIVTVTCFTERPHFQTVYRDLEAISDSFRFLK